MKMSEYMQFSDDEDLCLTQTATKEFSETPSCSYGGDVDMEYSEGLVSLECADQPNFQLMDVSEVFGHSSQKRFIYDNVEIEDISSDEEIDKM